MEANRGLRITEGTTERLISAADLESRGEDGVVHLGALLAVGDGRWVTVTADGDGYRASIPSASFTPGATLRVADARLSVSDGDTLCWNVKGVTHVEIGEARLADSVPEKPTH